MKNEPNANARGDYIRKKNAPKDRVALKKPGASKRSSTPASRVRELRRCRQRARRTLLLQARARSRALLRHVLRQPTLSNPLRQLLRQLLRPGFERVRSFSS